MKTSTFAVILSLTASAIATATTATGPTVYFPERNATCTDHTDGSITCESGHLDGAPVVEARVPAMIRGREVNPLDKRITCGLPIFGGTSCYIHCGLLGYCNHNCDEGICRCRCLDKSGPAGGLPCARTSCS